MEFQSLFLLEIMVSALISVMVWFFFGHFPHLSGLCSKVGSHKDCF